MDDRARLPSFAGRSRRRVVNVADAFGMRAVACNQHRGEIVGVFGAQLRNLARLRGGMTGECLDVLGHADRVANDQCGAST